MSEIVLAQSEWDSLETRLEPKDKYIRELCLSVFPQELEWRANLAELDNF